MNSSVIQLCLMALGALLIVCSAISDLRWREISNELNGLIAVLAIPFWVVSGWPLWPDVPLQVAAAMACFLAFAGLFYLNAMGGGDVKNVGAVMLWVPLPLFMSSLTVMAVVGGALSAVMLINIKMRPSDKPPEVPYGVAIAAAGLWALHQQYLNHFQVIGST